MAGPAKTGIFVPRGASTQVSAIGADVATKGLLHAYLTSERANGHHLVYNSFHVSVEERGRLQDAYPHRQLTFHDLASLSGFPDLAAIQCPGPLPFEDLAWRRYRTGASETTSLVGVCHTFSHHVAIDAVRRLVPAPAYEFDALVCPSHALRNALNRILVAEKAYYETEFGATNIRLPRTPVIPLGVASEAKPARADREAARAALHIAPDEVAVLFVGRLDFATKAHPFALLRGLRDAVAESGTQVRLILAGWDPDSESQIDFAGLKAELAPDLALTEIDGKTHDALSQAWQSADIFCSLVDNIQETFGLTPIEAKAAGLPVVVTDWDGYRETVRDGVDGFCIPTTGPGPEAGVGLVRDYTETGKYNPYVAATSQLVGVDLGALSAALVRLIQAPELRQAMGAAGQADAHARFAWPQVMAQYAELWDELAQERRAQNGARHRLPAGHRGQGRPYPFTLFQGYPTAWVADYRQVTAHPDLSRPTVEAILALPLVREYRPYIAETLDVPALAERIAAAGTAAIPDLLDSESQADRVYMGLAWLYKHGLVHLQDDDAQAH